MKKNQSTALTIATNTQAVQVLMPAPGMERAGRVNYFHQVAEEAGAISIKAAFFAGLELMKAKKELPHGQYEQWVDSNCNFSTKTACNYVAVATAYLDKKFDIKHLIDASDAERQQAVETASADCEDATLRQLYVELGIVKKSKSNLGGKREGAGRKRKEELSSAAGAAEAAENAGFAAQNAMELVGKVYEEGVIKQGFEAMDKSALKNAVESLKLALAEATKILKEKK